MKISQLQQIISHDIKGDSHCSIVQNIMKTFPQYSKKQINSSFLSFFKNDIQNTDILLFAVLENTNLNKITMKFITFKQYNREIKQLNNSIVPIELNVIAIFADKIILVQNVIQKLSTKRKISIGQPITQEKPKTKKLQLKMDIQNETVKNGGIRSSKNTIKQKQSKPLPKIHPSKPPIYENSQKQNIVNKRKQSSSDEQYFDSKKPQKKVEFEKLMSKVKISDNPNLTPNSKMQSNQNELLKTSQPHSNKMDIQQGEDQQDLDIQAMIAEAKRKKQQSVTNLKEQNKQLINNNKPQIIVNKPVKMRNGTLNAFFIKK